MGHETTSLCSHLDCCGAATVTVWAALRRRLYCPPLPDPARLRQRLARLPDRPQSPLRRGYRPQCAARLRPRGAGLLAGEIVPAPFGPALLGPVLHRTAEGPATPQP